MTPITTKIRTVLAAVFTAAIIGHTLFITTGCDGSSGDGPSGNSTVQGNIRSFSGGGAFYMPREQGNLLQELAGSIIEFVIPSSHAAVEGVTVSVQGTDLSGTTDDTGFFILSGVPAGPQVLLFTYNGQTVGLPIIVPASGIITITNVTIDDGVVDVSDIDVIEFDNNNDNDSSDDNSNDSDDNSSDNDDDSIDSDDNSNDSDDNDNS